MTRLWKTISVLELVVENLKGKTKTKSAYTIDVVDEPTQPEPSVPEKPKDWKAMDRLYRFDDKLIKGGSWWNKDFKFPCPIESHSHELYQCEAFLSMSPADRQKICKGKICKSLLSLGG